MLSVLDNLRTGAFTLPRARFAARLDQVYTYFPRLRDRAGKPAGSLSGGERQMLAIARAPWASTESPHLRRASSRNVGVGRSETAPTPEPTAGAQVRRRRATRGDAASRRGGLR
jgi:hypothetical protein